ncbi:hypothetical protein [Methanocella arvoryzae]|uniref:Uncharacterized protein n=1 Tax=Methanocella arvoryzae (strain DSM 22066 / NBRC 105507 / MRE50) TaxID=351160 RepID=Q0W753_METAR|nr:hypothetical protein [Methanocella arvoryzae]CAJ35790.1 hypothetical protein RCIX332 [Methanocella arvoryzae MRE50]
MSKAADKDQPVSDLDGRLMSLEQNIRGLNARMRAIERSFPGDKEQLRAVTCVQEPPYAHEEQEAYDFVPAAATAESCGYADLEVGRDHFDSIPSGPACVPDRKEKPGLLSQPFDLTGLIAGLIMILISALLFTGNVEMLKNPAIPFAFGALLIGWVCLSRYLGRSP